MTDNDLLAAKQECWNTLCVEKLQYKIQMEQQDFIWQCLPKDVREKIKKRYSGWNRAICFETECILYDELFGHHNLTSDTEPEEMLMVSRSEVQDRFNTFNNPNWASNEEESYGAQLVIDTLDLLFGDKCLPDKEPFVQGEPKFKYNIGDTVTYKGKVKKVISRKFDCRGNAIYTCGTINGQSPLVFNEIDLEPYNEPKFKVGDKVRYLSQNHEIGEIAAYWPNEKFCYSVRFGKEYHNMAEHQLEPYTEPETKNNMEEKELNLVELLKGCEGEAFYSPAFSVVTLKVIRDDRDKKSLYWEGGVSLFYTYIDGRIYSDSFPTIFPSRALYEKYPLDPYSAWMEWKSERIPKRWRAKKYEYFYMITGGGEVGSLKDSYTHYTNDLYELGNYFRTKELAKQATEAVQECLMKFHEKKSEE